jgi:hypothetical protein
MNYFKLIQEHFSTLSCSRCDNNFSKDGIKLLRKEDDFWIIKLFCYNCNTLAGIAIVGIELLENEEKIKNPEFTENDIIKFNTKPAITTDDVIEAHNFIKNLGSDWMKYIKK